MFDGISPFRFGIIKKLNKGIICVIIEINYVATTTGDTDISISVVSATMGDQQTIINKKLHSIPGMRKTHTYVLTNILTQNCNWSFSKKITPPEE